MTRTAVEPGSVGTPERREPHPITPVEHEGLIDGLFGPHEWGYRCPVEGVFIEDNRPFEAATTIRTQAAELAEWKAASKALSHALADERERTIALTAELARFGAPDRPRR